MKKEAHRGEADSCPIKSTAPVFAQLNGDNAPGALQASLTMGEETSSELCRKTTINICQCNR